MNGNYLFANLLLGQYAIIKYVVDNCNCSEETKNLLVMVNESQKEAINASAEELMAFLEENESYDADYCYECTGYGDDYYFDDDGNMVCACDECPFGPYVEE